MSVIDNLPYVEAELRYSVPISTRPRYVVEPRSNGIEAPPGEARQVRIHDMRPLASEIDLDRQGFALIQHRSEVRDFWDEEEVRGVYYPEMARHIEAILGARRALPYDHLHRRRDPDPPADAPAQPARRVHADRSGGSIGSSFIWRSMRSTRLERLRRLLGDEAEELMRGRCQALTLWRPIRGPVLDTPLAVCDARTIAPSDLVQADMVFLERVAERQSIMHNPAHRWYYAPEMGVDEALLIKNSDTSKASAQFAPHAAFTHPTTPPDAPPRESIETRILVFYHA